VRNPERIPFLDKQCLREHWPEARAEILRREHAIRHAESIPCSHCGVEVGHWAGHNLWVSSPTYHLRGVARSWRGLCAIPEDQPLLRPRVVKLASHEERYRHS
jgi:hypothetical protein